MFADLGVDNWMCAFIVYNSLWSFRKGAVGKPTEVAVTAFWMTIPRRHPSSTHWMQTVYAFDYGRHWHRSKVLGFAFDAQKVGTSLKIVEILKDKRCFQSIVV